MKSPHLACVPSLPRALAVPADDTAAAHAVTASGFHYLPAKAHHYAFTNASTIIQITRERPFDINYIDAKDDPQKSARQ